MNLNDALKEFADAYNASPEHDGTIHFRTPVAISEPFPIGQTLHTYFSCLEIADRAMVGGRLNLRMYELDMLLTAQAGWYYIVDQQGNRVEDTKSWKKTWVVIADKNGDAIFVDIDTPDGKVYGSIQKRNFFVAESLALFLATLAKCMLVEQNEFNYEVMDEDFNVLEPFMNRLIALTQQELGQEGSNGFIKFFVG